MRASAAESSVCSHACSAMAHGPTRGGGRRPSGRSAVRPPAVRVYRLQVWSNLHAATDTDTRTHTCADTQSVLKGSLESLCRRGSSPTRRSKGCGAHPPAAARRGAAARGTPPRDSRGGSSRTAAAAAARCAAPRTETRQAREKQITPQACSAGRTVSRSILFMSSTLQSRVALASHPRK